MSSQKETSAQGRNFKSYLDLNILICLGEISSSKFENTSERACSACKNREELVSKHGEGSILDIESIELSKQIQWLTEK